MGKGNAIETTGLSKKYANGFLALNGIDLSVKEGEIFAILGPNGAGKTTLMRMLTTQILPTGGRALVMGLDVVREGPAVRRVIGHVPQEFSLWNDITGRENLLVYARIYGLPWKDEARHVNEALRMMGLSDAADKEVRDYSGGMVRRLELAASLLTEPKILLLDEPTVGLDPISRRKVWSFLKRIRKRTGATIFFSTHYLDEADKYATRVCLLRNGELILSDSVGNLKRSFGDSVEIAIPSSRGLKEADFLRVKSIRGASIGKRSISVSADDATTALPMVLDVLLSKGIHAKKISVSRASLEDIFVKFAASRQEEARSKGLRQVRARVRRS